MPLETYKKLEDMTTEERTKKVIDDFEDAKAGRRSLDELWIDIYKKVRMVLPPEEMNENGSNLQVPYLWQSIQNILAKVVLALFNNRPYFKLVPRYPEDKSSTESHSRLLDYQLDKQGVIKRMSEILQCSLIFGLGISKQRWEYRERKVLSSRFVEEPMIDDDTGEELPFMDTKREVVERMVVEDDMPLLEPVDIFDFWIAPGKLNIDDSPYAIHVYPLSIDEFLANVEEDVYDISMEKAKEIIDGKSEEYMGEEELGVDRRLDTAGLGTSSRIRKSEIEIIEYWTDDHLCVLANKQEVAFIDNPYWHGKKPFTEWTDNQMPFEFCGLGEGYPNKDLQDELNETRRQRIDNISLVLNKCFTVLRSADINPDDLVIRPGGAIPVDDHDDIRELRFTDVTQSGYQEESVIKQDIDNNTGVYSYQRGAPAIRRETATTAEILAEAGTDRFRLKIIFFMESAKKAVLQLAALNKQFKDETEFIPEVQDFGEFMFDSIEPQMLQGEFSDVVVAGAATDPQVNKAMMQQQWTQLYSMLQNNELVNQPEMLKRILKVFGEKQPEELIIQQQAPEEQPAPPMMPPGGEPPMGGMGGGPGADTGLDIASMLGQGGGEF